MTYPTRSWLFTPATRPERFAKAAAIGADVLIVDLEDAVALADKDDARRTALAYLGNDAGRGTMRFALRINGLDTAAGISDLRDLLAARVAPDFLILPKTESADHVRLLDRLLSEAGIASQVVALVESARGLAAVDRIAGASPRLFGLAFGAADMAADLGAATAWEPLYHARARLVAASAMARITAIDSPFFALGDAAGMTEETDKAIALGFAAKMAIHPDQVASLNAALTPSAYEIKTAHAVLAANAKGVGVIDGRMIDEAVARKARRVLAAAARPGQ